MSIISYIFIVTIFPISFTYICSMYLTIFPLKLRLVSFEKDVQVDKEYINKAEYIRNINRKRESFLLKSGLFVIIFIFPINFVIFNQLLILTKSNLYIRNL